MAKGIEVLDNDTGFFMMVEGGKIDWACHANDAGSTIADTIALSEAVDVAIEFAKSHADETLIVVTGDHETGGLTIGYAGTDYDTYLANLSNQKISYAKFDSDYVAKYRENKTSFEDVLKDVEALFGLKTTGGEGDTLVLTASSPPCFLRKKSSVRYQILARAPESVPVRLSQERTVPLSDFLFSPASPEAQVPAGLPSVSAHSIPWVRLPAQKK